MSGAHQDFIGCDVTAGRSHEQRSTDDGRGGLDIVDFASAASFPASDAPSWTPFRIGSPQSPSVEGEYHASARRRAMRNLFAEQSSSVGALAHGLSAFC